MRTQRGWLMTSLHICICTVLCALAPHAHAQAVQTDVRPDEAVAVTERPRPDYEAVGIHRGAFTLYPSLTVTGAYADNIYAASGPTQDDLITTFRPQLNIVGRVGVADYTSYARMIGSVYAAHGGEDTLDLAGGGAATFHVNAFSLLQAALDVERTTEPRTSTNTARDVSSPIQFDRVHLNGSAERALGPFSLNTQVDFEHFSYDDGRTASGVLVPEGDRDRSVVQATVRAGYGTGARTSFFAYANGNSRRYDLSPPSVALDRDSQGFDVGLGARFDFSHLVRGEVELGYLSQFYDDAQFSTVEGISAHGRVTWLVTQLTTLNFTAERSVQDAQDIRARNYITNNGSFSIDHELLRNVLLSARFMIYHDEYEGIDRRDDHYSLDFRATYLLNRRLGLSFRCSRIDVDSVGADRIPSFAANVISLGAVFQI